MYLSSKLLILFLTVLLTSCSLLDRRDFEMVMDDRFNEDMWVPEKDFPVVPGDSGRSFRSDEEVFSRVPATEDMTRDLKFNRSLNSELRALENKLSENEWEDYRKIRNQIGSTSQKIYFLKLPYREKLEYMRARNITLKKSYTVRDVYSNNIYTKNPIGLGMSKDEVINRWGRPVNRQYSGSPGEQNEKWSYQQDGKVKYIYFDHGHVEGWTEQ
jgi:hypothetical protein